MNKASRAIIHGLIIFVTALVTGIMFQYVCQLLRVHGIIK